MQIPTQVTLIRMVADMLTPPLLLSCSEAVVQLIAAAVTDEVPVCVSLPSLTPPNLHLRAGANLILVVCFVDTRCLFLYLFPPPLLPACLSGREGLEGSTGGCQRGHESCPPRCGHGGHCMSGVCPLASVLLCRVCLSRNAPCVFIVKHQGKVYTEHHLPPTMHPSRP